jgi:hypothetical protein
MWTLDQIIERGVRDQIVDQILANQIIELIRNGIVGWTVGDCVPQMTKRLDIVTRCRLDWTNGMGSDGMDGLGKT